jgi:hypothetical protein
MLLLLLLLLLLCCCLCVVSRDNSSSRAAEVQQHQTFSSLHSTFYFDTELYLTQILSYFIQRDKTRSSAMAEIDGESQKVPVTGDLDGIESR